MNDRRSCCSCLNSLIDYECFSMKQHLGCFAFTFKFLLKYKCYANSLMSLLELILHEMKTPTTISECRAGKQTNIRYLFNLRYTVQLSCSCKYIAISNISNNCVWFCILSFLSLSFFLCVIMWSLKNAIVLFQFYLSASLLSSMTLKTLIFDVHVHCIDCNMLFKRDFFSVHIKIEKFDNKSFYM